MFPSPSRIIEKVLINLLTVAGIVAIGFLVYIWFF